MIYGLRLKCIGERFVAKRAFNLYLKLLAYAFMTAIGISAWVIFHLSQATILHVKTFFNVLIFNVVILFYTA